MKKLKQFNVYKLNHDRYDAWRDANPEASRVDMPVSLYDMVQIEAWLLNTKDLCVFGGMDVEEAKHYEYKGIKFVVHHSLGTYTEDMPDYWDASEYSTSGKLIHGAKEKRHEAIYELVNTLYSYKGVLEKTLAKKQETWGIINK